MRHPKDEQIFAWDPENMDKYWSQCRAFDYYPQISILESETANASYTKCQAELMRQTRAKYID